SALIGLIKLFRSMSKAFFCKSRSVVSHSDCKKFSALLYLNKQFPSQRRKIHSVRYNIPEYPAALFFSPIYHLICIRSLAADLQFFHSSQRLCPLADLLYPGRSREVFLLFLLLFLSVFGSSVWLTVKLS